MIIEKGYDPGAYTGFPGRIEMQDALYAAYQHDFALHEHFVTDRCYVDLIAFTMMEVNNDIDRVSAEWCKKYTTDMIASQKDFDCVIVVPPAIDIVAASGKAAPIRSLIDNIHWLCVGVLNDSKIPHLLIPAECTNLDERIDVSLAYIDCVTNLN